MNASVSKAGKIAVVLVAAWAVGYLGIWQWGTCRVEVPPGQSLLLRYKGPFPFAFRATSAPDGTLVKLDSSGRPPARSGSSPPGWAGACHRAPTWSTARETEASGAAC